MLEGRARLGMIAAAALLSALLVLTGRAVGQSPSEEGLPLQHGAEVPLSAMDGSFVGDSKGIAGLPATSEPQPAPLEVRQASASAYEDQPRADARKLATDTFSEFYDGLEPSPLEEGMKFVRFRGDHSAVVQPNPAVEPDKQLLFSSTPLRVSEDGVKRPVDLGLVQTSKGYEPKTPVMPVTFPSSLDAGIEAVGGDLVMDFEGSEQATAPVALDDASLFYAEVATDTDLTVAPTDSGFQFALQIRSAKAPEQFRLPLTLPAGAQLSASPDGGARIENLGERSLTITAPVTVDADQRPVQSSLTVDGDVLVLHVPHRSAAPHYPLLVDPTIFDDTFTSDPSTHGWRAFEGVAGSPPSATPYSLFAGNDGTGDAGLYSWAAGGTYAAGARGIWSYSVPHIDTSTDAYINYVRFDKISFNSPGTPVSPYLYFGVFSPPTSAYYQEGSASYVQSASTSASWSTYWFGPITNVGLNGNGAKAQVARFELVNVSYVPTTLTSAQYRAAYLSGFRIYLADGSDPSAPKVTGQSPTSTQWLSGGNASIDLTATDGGAGVRSIQLEVGTTSTATTFDQTDSCTAAGYNIDEPCSQSRVSAFTVNSSTLDNGINSLYSRSTDVVGRPSLGGLALTKVGSTTTPAEIRVDREKPVVHVSRSGAGASVIEVTAEDGDPGSNATARSGVAKIALYNVTDSHEEASATYSCTATKSSCAVGDDEAPFSTTTSGLDLGDSYEVRVTDQAGNPPQAVAVDVAPPETSITSGPDDGSTIGSSSTSFGFTSPESEATFECSLDAAAYTGCTSPKPLSNLSDGSHTFSVRAKDAVGNVDQTPSSRTFTVDTTAPETSITSGPAEGSTIDTASPSFEFDSPESGASFECSLDAGTFASCTSPKALSGLSEGSHTFSVRAVDGAGNVDATPSSRTFTVDTNTAPTDIQLSNASVAENELPGTPVGELSSTDADVGDNFTYSLVTGSGDDDNGAFDISGQTLSAAETFDYENRPTYSVRVATDDGHGGSYEKAFAISVVNANDPPTEITLPDSEVDEGQPAGTVVGELATSDQDAGETFTYSLVAGTGDVDNSSFQLDGAEVETTEAFNYETDSSYSIRVKSQDSGGATVEGQLGITVTPPPLPELDPTPVDESVATNTFDATEFLYSDSDPVQPDVEPGAIDPEQASVIRGRVTDPQGDPLSAVIVTAPHHPEYGETLTREDGRFFFAANGGDDVLLRYELDGYATAERTGQVSRSDYDWFDDVVLMPLSSEHKEVELSGDENGAQVVQGAEVTDADGTRQQTLIFPPQTEAEMELESGATQPVDDGTIRATEFTEGDDDAALAAMPGDLPPTTDYTYAVEYSVDEAVDSDAASVQFSKPVVGYLDNFLHLPVGADVPVGSWDQERGAWVPEDDGRVVKVLAEQGGSASLDIDGSGSAADSSSLEALGVTAPELAKVAQLYEPGDELWRTEHTHFTSFDYNMPSLPPGDATAASGDLTPGDPDSECQDPGSIIYCETQSLGERLPVAGTGMSLNYRSDRSPAHKAVLDIPLTDDDIPQSLKRIEVTVGVAGRRYEESFDKANLTPNQSYRFEWDRVDAFGREVYGPQWASVRISYVYLTAGSAGAAPGVQHSFGQAGSGNPITLESRTGEFAASTEYRRKIGTWDARSAGLGGWTLSQHHVYDPVTHTIFFGDGTHQAAAPEAVNVFAGGAPDTGTAEMGDGGPAREASLYFPQGMDFGPDGSMYVADFHHDRVRKIAPDGTITTVAGSGVPYTGSGSHFSGDGGAATQATLNGPKDVVISPSGILYVSDSINNRVRAVDLGTGEIDTVAGSGGYANSDPGQYPALEVGLDAPNDLALGPDGSLYIGDRGNYQIRKLTPDGRLSTVAGPNGDLPTPGNRVSARNLYLIRGQGPFAVDHEGNLYMSDTYTKQILKIDAGGKVSVFAGNGVSGNAGDGGPAIDAELDVGNAVDLDDEGNLYLAGDNRVRRVDGAGTIDTVFGPGTNTSGAWEDEGMPPSEASVNSIGGIRVGPDGDLFVASLNMSRIFRAGNSMPGYSGEPIRVANTAGTEVYDFDAQGRHLDTLDATTGVTLAQFGYDSAGRLTSVEDGDGNVTTIERDTTGKATAIVAPFGQVTNLNVNANDRLTSLTNPEDESYSMGYSTAGQLDSLTDPRNNTATFEYDGDGLLTRDNNAGAGYKTLSRDKSKTGYEVEVATKLGRAHSVANEQLSDGRVRRTSTDSAGLQTVQETSRDGGRVTMQTPDGTLTTQDMAADPRLGIQAPYAASTKVETPGGKVLQIDTTREAELTDPGDPFSFSALTETDSVNGQTSTSTFDPSTNTLEAVSADGRTSELDLDAKGRPAMQTSPGITPISYAYDSHGRPTSTTQGARQSTLTYDADGNVATVTDPLDRTQSYDYDQAGRITSQTLPDSRVITYAYDDAGNLTSVTPPGRGAYTTAHDALGLPSQNTRPSVGDGADPSVYNYNDDHELTSIDQPDGTSVGFSHDAAGRVDQITEPGAVSTDLNYDAATGQLDSIQAPANVDLAFDFDGTLPLKQTLTGPVAGEASASYDDNLRIDQVKLNGQDPLAYGYDADSLLTQAGALDLDRSPTTGQLEGTTLDTVSSANAYNGFGERTSEQFSRSGTSLFSSAYVRDDGGRITEKTETTAAGSVVWDYDYDDAGRLVDVNRDGTDYAAYTYDSNSNRLTLTDGGATTSSTYDAQDRLSTRGNWSYDYTKNGYLQQKTNTANSQASSYEYDSLGNLDHVELPNGDDLDYLTDGLGRRVGKKVNGQLEQGFLYGPGAVGPVAELDSQGNVVSRFVYATSATSPDYMIQGSDVYRIIKDQVGSPRLVVDASTGTVAQELEYGPFGEVVSDTSPGFQPFGFAGGLYDADTGLVRFGARDYDAETGRWTASDPIGFAGGQANLYGYVINDPVNLVDSSGLSLIGVDLGIVDRITGEFDDVITNGESWAFAQNEALGAVHVFSLGAIDAPCPGDGYGVGQFLALNVAAGVGAEVVLAQASASAAPLARLLESGIARSNAIAKASLVGRQLINRAVAKLMAEYPELTEKAATELAKRLVKGL